MESSESCEACCVRERVREGVTPMMVLTRRSVLLTLRMLGARMDLRSAPVLSCDCESQREVLLVGE